MIIIPNIAGGPAPPVVKGAATHGDGQPVAMPPNVAGDLIIVFKSSEYGNQYTYPVPSGWTAIYTSVSGGNGITAAYKVSNGSEPSSISAYSWGGYDSITGVIVLSGQNASNPIGAKQANYLEYSPNTQGNLASEIALQNSSGSSAVIALGFGTTFSGIGVAYSSTTAAGWTTRSSYNLNTAGYGRGAIISSLNDTAVSLSSGGAGGIFIATKGNPGGHFRAGTATLEILGQ